MGLAGRRTKQRIAADPRNLAWSDDASKFGAKYLQSLGWTQGMGLGASGEGRTSNLKIHQKLDLMGIGANRRGADDAGWKGGHEFEGILARLNQVQEEDSQEIPLDCKNTMDSDHDHHASGTKIMPSLELAGARDHAGEPHVDTQRDTGKAQEEVREKKRRKKSAIRVEAKEVKRRKMEAAGEEATDATTNGPERKQRVEQVGCAITPEKSVPRHRAHRARHIASKRLAATSTTSINEILGIASSTANGQASGTTSRSSVTQVSPSSGGQPAVDDMDQDRAPGLGLTRKEDLLEQDGTTDEPSATQGSGTGFEYQFAFGSGLGFRGASKMAAQEAAKGNVTNDLLRPNGKSVAEYFEEKMRKKTVANNLPVGGGEPQRKKKKKSSS